jgi:DNA sulfur modification protein DndC
LSFSRQSGPAREIAPVELRDIELISRDELEEIRRIWVFDKHEFEDSLPRIYEQASGETYPYGPLEESNPLQPDDLQLLRETCSEHGDQDGVQFRLLRELLHIEESYRHASRRAGLYDQLEKVLKEGGFANESEALSYAIAQQSTDPMRLEEAAIGYELDDAEPMEVSLS